MHLLSYVSTSLVPAKLVEEELATITTTAVEQNSQHGITGVLFFQGNHFFQVIEGEERDLRALYQRLERDPRHSDLAKLLDEPTTQRQFSDWSMDTFYVDNPDIINPKTLALIQQLYLHNFGAEAQDLIAFTKHMIDEMDTFRIQHQAVTRMN